MTARWYIELDTIDRSLLKVEARVLAYPIEPAKEGELHVFLDYRWAGDPHTLQQRILFHKPSLDVIQKPYRYNFPLRGVGEEIRVRMTIEDLPDTQEDSPHFRFELIHPQLCGALSIPRMMM